MKRKHKIAKKDHRLLWKEHIKKRLAFERFLCAPEVLSVMAKWSAVTGEAVRRLVAVMLESQRTIEEWAGSIYYTVHERGADYDEALQETAVGAKEATQKGY